ncbi:MAG: magnesium transporter [Rhodobacterales bacterium]|nr:magnesium transporter [Rhodobacterales bacterium]
MKEGNLEAEEDTVDVGTDLIDSLREALQSEDTERVETLTLPLHDADLADVIERLPGDERNALVHVLRDTLNPEVLSELDITVRESVIEQLDVEEVAAFVAEMATDDAVELVSEMDAANQREILDAIPAEDRTLIEQGLAYPDDSAGRLMQRELVTVPKYYSVGETIDFMRLSADRDEAYLPPQFYEIYVVDPAHRPIGAVPLSRLLRTRRPVRVQDIMDTELRTIPVAMDQEEVAFLFRQRDLVSAPVIDPGGRLIGAITIDDVVDVIDEEHEEDIMRLGGVREDDLYSAVLATTRSRFSWLLVNLGTAVAASLVIGLFEATIEQIVALAVLMPIVASMGGNAGTQTLTVAVRALATRELTPSNAWRIVGKELMVGSINGVLFALLTGVVAWLWFESPVIGGIIAAAMVINMVVAGLAGTTIPLALARMKIDPAIASSVFLTTVTDVVGFFAFLGLAAWLLM